MLCGVGVWSPSGTTLFHRWLPAAAGISNLSSSTRMPSLGNSNSGPNDNNDDDGSHARTGAKPGCLSPTDLSETHRPAEVTATSPMVPWHSFRLSIGKMGEVLSAALQLAPSVADHHSNHTFHQRHVELTIPCGRLKSKSSPGAQQQHPLSANVRSVLLEDTAIVAVFSVVATSLPSASTNSAPLPPLAAVLPTAMILLTQHMMSFSRTAPSYKAALGAAAASDETQRDSGRFDSKMVMSNNAAHKTQTAEELIRAPAASDDATFSPLGDLLEAIIRMAQDQLTKRSQTLCPSFWRRTFPFSGSCLSFSVRNVFPTFSTETIELLDGMVHRRISTDCISIGEWQLMVANIETVDAPDSLGSRGGGTSPEDSARSIGAVSSDGGVVSYRVALAIGKFSDDGTLVSVMSSGPPGAPPGRPREEEVLAVEWIEHDAYEEDSGQKEFDGFVQTFGEVIESLSESRMIRPHMIKKAASGAASPAMPRPTADDGRTSPTGADEEGDNNDTDTRQSTPATNPLSGPQQRQH